MTRPDALFGLLSNFGQCIRMLCIQRMPQPKKADELADLEKRMAELQAEAAELERRLDRIQIPNKERPALLLESSEEKAEGQPKQIPAQEPSDSLTDDDPKGSVPSKDDAKPPGTD